jgi:hypothetical protein
MDLQTIFYVLAIVVMITWLIFLIMLTAVVWTLYSGIKNAPKRIEEAVTNIIETNKSSLVGMAGVTLGSFILGRMKSWFKKD